MFCIEVTATTPQADMSEIKRTIVVISESLVAGDVLLKSMSESIVEAVSIVEVVSAVEVISMAEPEAISAVSGSGIFIGSEPEANISDTSNGAD